MLLKNATLNGIQQKNKFRENLLKLNVRKTNMMVAFGQWRKKGNRKATGNSQYGVYVRSKKSGV